MEDGGQAVGSGVPMHHGRRMEDGGRAVGSGVLMHPRENKKTVIKSIFHHIYTLAAQLDASTRQAHLPSICSNFAH